MSTTCAKSKEAFHERDASFSSSVQSSDSVFTEDLMEQGSPTMGPSHTKSRSDRPYSRKSPQSASSTKSFKLQAGQQITSDEIQPSTQRYKCSPKDSAYGSRLNTDEFPSPPISDGSSPRSLASPNKSSSSHLGMGSGPVTGTDAVKILPLSHSPVLVNNSYLQFYFNDDPVTLLHTVQSKNETKRTLSSKTHHLPSKLVSEQAKGVHKKKFLSSLHPIKSASCSTIDRMSLTSSLEEYASNLEKVNVTVEGPTDEVTGMRRERLLSLTRFETLTRDLESPLCATVVKVVVPSGSGREGKKQRKHLLSRFRKKKAETAAKSPTNSSKGLEEVIMTPAGQAKLRKMKEERHGRQRKVVSDDLTHKVHFQAAETQTAMRRSEHFADMRKKEQQYKEHGEKYLKCHSLNSADERPILSGEKRHPRAGMHFVQENHIGSYATELSQSTDGLADLTRLSMQLRMLAQPSQSTTNLDLSQRASETISNIGLMRTSHSMDDITDSLGAPLSQGHAESNELPREGFLWRVLGRANQRCPALIHIVPIQSRQVGISGLCVRKGQQVRALYRVSGQVIVEMETNHLASIPYECCRISRKHYGPKSTLVEMSYTHLYTAVPSVPNSQSPQHTAQTPLSKTKVHVPIEMVAILDCYDCLPPGEINVDAGDKLRVLYCDDKMVYAVKENGEAGLMARNFCRLTRKSEKLYQKWVEHTRSPFQADFPVRFNEKPPNFLIDLVNGTLTEKKTSSSNPTSRNLDTTNVVEIGTKQQGMSPPAKGGKRADIACSTLRETNTSAAVAPVATGEQQQRSPTSPPGKGRKPAGVARSFPQKGVQSYLKPLLPPTPLGKRKETPVSPLTKSGLKSPSRDSSAISPVTTDPPPPTTKSAISPKQATECAHIATTPPGNSAPQTLTCSTHEKCTHNTSTSHVSEISRKPLNYSGKLMTVVHNYVPNVGTVDYTIRKGLRVRVVRASPDGKTLRVATKTGSQFDIPVSHLCFSRKNSEPLTYRQHTNSDVSNGNCLPCVLDHIPQVHPPSHTPMPPLECGKIMTVIHDFVPTQENPMLTIRRGLRVKVLGGQDDQVKVQTKTGSIFCIPRSHLRLSHKTSDASVFPRTNSPPSNHESLKRISSADQKSDSSHVPVHSNPRQVQVNNSSSSCGREGTDNTNAARSLHPPNERGSRVSSTGSQVFELC